MARFTSRSITKVIKKSEAGAERMGAKAKKLAVKAMDKVTGKTAARKRRTKIAAVLTGAAAVVAAGVAISRSSNPKAKKAVKAVKSAARSSLAKAKSATKSTKAVKKAAKRK